MTLTQQGGPKHEVYVGHSKKFGWFAIKKDCGNLVTTKQPPAPPKPQTSCETVKAKALNPTRFRFTAKGSTTGAAKIESYTFVVRTADDNKEVHRKIIKSSTTTETYDYSRTKPGSYTVTVRISTSLRERVRDCRAAFSVKETTPASAVCSSLNARIINRTNVELTAAATVYRATVNKYTFVIKDSKGKVVSTKPIVSSATKVIADAVVIGTPGTYTAQVTVST